jgi:ubiquinone/menaquinone biosynthesis C-methylase UbiE
VYGTRLFRDRWPRNQLVKARFIAECLPAEGVTLADIGCGNGQILEALLDRGTAADAYAVDPAPSMLDQTRERLGRFGDRATLVQAQAEELPLDDESVDAAVAVDVLHHLLDPRAALAEVARILRPGGRLVVLDSNPRFPVTLLIALGVREERDILRNTKSRFRRRLLAAGLEPVEVGFAPLYTPPGPDPLVPIYDRLDRALFATRLLRPFAIFYRVVGQKSK